MIWGIDDTVVLDADTRDVLFTIQGEMPQWSFDGTRIATHTGSELRIWDGNNGSELLTLPASGIGLYGAVAWSPDGKQLAVAGGFNVVVWNISPNNLAYNDLDKVVNAAWSPDGSQFMTSSDDGTAKIWDTNTQTLF